MELSEPKQRFETLLSLFEDVANKRYSGDFSVKKNINSPQVPPRAYSLYNVTGGNVSSYSNQQQQLQQQQQQQQQNNNNSEISSNNSTPSILLSPTPTPQTTTSPNTGFHNRPLSVNVDQIKPNNNINSKDSVNKPLRLSGSPPTASINGSQVEQLLRELKNEREAHQQTKYLINSIREENKKLSNDCQLWRAKYYKLLTKNTKLKVIFDHFQNVMNESDAVPGEGSLAHSTSYNSSSSSSSGGNLTPRKLSLVGTKSDDPPQSASAMSNYHHQRNPSTGSTYSNSYIGDEKRRETISYLEKSRRPTVGSSTFFPPSRAPSTSSIQVNGEPQEIAELTEEEYLEMLEKRRQISLQILQTEKEYAFYLNIIVEEFLHPLKNESNLSNNPFISKAQVKQLFGDTEVILGSSKLLAEDLENVLLDGTSNPIGLGDCFLKICDYFKLYASYVKNYYTSISVLNKLKEESHKFQAFIQEKEQILLDSNFTDLGALLVLPVSRIGQYTSMINYLFSLTPQSHPDYEPFKNAVIKMKSTVDYVKEKIRDNDSQNKVRIIQNQMTGKFENLNLPHRRYVREGLLTESSKGSNSTQYYCFLFNDIFVLSTPIKKSNQFAFKKKISLSEAEVTMISDPDDRPIFQISIQNIDSQQDNSPNMLSLNGIQNAINNMTNSDSKSKNNDKNNSNNNNNNNSNNNNGNNGNGNGNNGSVIDIKGSGVLINSNGSNGGSGFISNGNNGINVNSNNNNSNVNYNNNGEDSNDRECFTFIADSNRDREDWIQAIQANIISSKKRNETRKPEDIEKGGIDFSTSDIKLCEQIGAGGSGCTVHRCTVDGFTCAVKVLKLKNTSPFLVEQFISEITIMVKLSHQNIAKYLGHRLSGNQLWLFMEFYPHSLKDIITKRTSPFPATEVIWMALEIAKGLEFLHTQKPPIIHRDLKPGNIMCSLDDKGRVCNIRVCDFDTSKELGSGVTLKTCIGTPCYMAAEVLNVADGGNSGYSLKADIWSFAMLCFEIISLLPPYHQFQHLQSIEMIINGTCPPLPTDLIQPKLLQPLIELLVTCIDLNPNHRPTASQLVQKLTKMLKNSGMMIE
ncbi:hypothetical protein ACTFIU_004254 [Dictyostelium citrinum]